MPRNPSQHVEVKGSGDSRSAVKRRAILDAATTLFLRDGYQATSMDEIAGLAGVSKQTVYSQFGDKENLFRDVVTAVVDEAATPVFAEVSILPDGGDLESDLRDLASRLLARVIQPRLLQLRRLVISEAGRFPELGRLFYERGPGRTIGALADAFERLAAGGILRIEDPHLAAEHFNWLVMSIPINRVMLCGEDALPLPADLDRYAHAGVEAFLGAYASR
jgi:AcrR family transcriptional regulator